MRKLWLIVAGILVGGMALGQGLPNPLDVGLGVRALGLGGAYTGLAEGSEALLYNPAGLAWQPGLRADSSYTGAMGLYGVGWLAGAMPSFGGGLAYLSVGDIVDPEGGALSYSQFALVAGAGFDTGQVPMLAIVPFPAAVGVNLKLASAQVAGESAIGMALDLGVLGRLSVPLVGQLNVGLALRDLGFGLGIGEDGAGWSTDIAAGASFRHPLGVFGALELGSRYTALGVGWAFMDMLELRGGVQLAAGVSRWTLGLGVAWDSFFLDYALVTHPFLGSSHMLGFGVDLDALLGR